MKDGLEVVASADVARAQLCDPVDGVVRLPTVAETAAVTICGEEAVSCVDGLLRVCAARGQPARLAGACVIGCAAGVSLDPGDVLLDGATAILCRRH